MPILKCCGGSSAKIFCFKASASAPVTPALRTSRRLISAVIGENLAATGANSLLLPAATVSDSASHASERKFERALHDAWRNGADTRNLPEVRISGIRIRLTETRVVQGVEGFPAELNPVAFLECPILDQSEVSRVDRCVL